MKTKSIHIRTLRGFSLVELITVVAIICVMMSLILPSIAGFSSTAGRRGAVNLLMNTFEQARVAALESGQNVYVGFADADFPVEEMRYASFVVFRDATEEEMSNGSGNYVVLKKWTSLPKDISIKRVKNTLVPETGGTQQFPGLKAALPGSMQDDTFPVITFNSSGTIETDAQYLALFLYDGYYLAGQDNPARTKNVGLYEKISFSRYTGRSQLDVTATPAS